MTPETRSSGPVNPARILVIKLRHHGDMLLITPLIHALKQQYPAPAWMCCCMKKPGICSPLTLISTRFSPLTGAGKNRGKATSSRWSGRLIRTLRQQRYDMVLNLADQWPSAIITN
jgi:heptosyltransferase-3